MGNSIMANYNVDDIYKAMAWAETGTFRNPWIRTVAEGTGSNAYGPVQILSKTMSEATKQVYKESGKPMIKFTKDELAFIDRFAEQGKKFYKYGGKDMVPGMEMYDYGGSGDITEQDKRLYESAAKKIISYEFNRAGGDVDKFQEAWRGPTEHFRGGKDVRHSKKFRGKLEDLSGIRELMSDETVMGEFIKENVR